MGRHSVERSLVNDWQEYLRFRDRFANILDRRFYTREWLDYQVLTGNFRLFSADDSAILVSTKVYPTGAKELHAEAAVGELKAIEASLIPHFIEWAKRTGCIAASVESRPAWRRVMRKFGLETYQTTVRRLL